MATALAANATSVKTALESYNYDVFYVVCRLIVGLYAKKHSFKLSTWQTILIVVIAEIVITTLNTGVLYIDSKIYGYYSAVYIFGTLLPRYAICVGKAAAKGAILPLLISALDKIKHKGAIWSRTIAKEWMKYKHQG